MNFIEQSPALVIAVPLLAAFLVPLIGKLGNRIRNLFVIMSFLLTEFFALLLTAGILRGNISVYTLGSQVPSLTSPVGFPVRIILLADPYTVMFSLLVVTVSLLCAVFSYKYLSKKTGLDKFYSLLLLLTAGMVGISLTADFFTLFVFLEVASISSAGLIAYLKTGESFEAAFKYISLSAVGALFLLIGVGLFYGQYGSLNMLQVTNQMPRTVTMLELGALALIGSALLLKSGAFPVHMWKADVYSQAPLNVVIMLLTQSFISLAVLFRIYFTFLEPVLFSPIGWIIVIMGGLSIIVGVTMAIPQKNLLRLMAYTAVAEIGYIVMALGTGLIIAPKPGSVSYHAMSGGLFHMINDTLDLGLLFLLIGTIMYVTKSKDTDRISGLGHHSTILTILFLIGLLAISGIPPTNGFVSKLIIYESIYFFNPMLAVIGILGSILMLTAFMKVFSTIFLGSGYKGKVIKLPVTMLIPLLVIAFLIIFLGLFPDVALDSLIHPAVESLIRPYQYIGGLV